MTRKRFGIRLEKKMILSKKDFLSPKINWHEKYKNIKKIICKWVEAKRLYFY